jgi:hypothetical protein
MYIYTYISDTTFVSFYSLRGEGIGGKGYRLEVRGYGLKVA